MIRHFLSSFLRAAFLSVLALVGFCTDCTSQRSAGSGYAITATSIDESLIAAKKQRKPDSSIPLYNKALNNSIDINYKHGALTALNGIGFAYVDKGDYLQSRSYFTRAFSYAANSGNKRDSAICHNNIGLSYQYLGDYEKAAEYYYLALSELKNNDSIATTAAVNTWNNLATINMRLNQYSKALSILRTAEAICRSKGYSRHLAMTVNNKAIVYTQDSSKADSALSCFYELWDIG